MRSDLSELIIDAAKEVHQLLGGPGLLEAIYETALCRELALRGVQTQRQVPIPVVYKGASVREPLYLDILVENALIVEVKATERDFPFYQIQLFTYLRLLGIETGLLLNFGKRRVDEGVVRLTNALAAK